MISKKQKQILDFVNKYQKRYNHPPSAKRIQKHFNLTSVAKAYSHIKNLKRAGYLEMVNSQPVRADVFQVTSSSPRENFRLVSFKRSLFLRKVMAFVTSFGFILSLGLGSAALAAVTISGTGITGDSSFSSITGAT